jgi:hypothetical protein
LSGPSYAYLFEAKGIQRYILDSGPLRDLVGASDLVAGLTASDGDDLLAAVLKRVELSDGKLSRRAGGSFMAHAASREPLLHLRALWRLTASLRCPGLEMSDVLLDGATALSCEDDVAALNRAYDLGSAVRFNTAAELPPTGHPLTDFNPRTGRLTTWRYKYGADTVNVDVLTEAHRERAEALRDNLDGVAKRFLPVGVTKDPAGLAYAFPRNLELKDRERADNPLFPFRQRSGGPRGDDPDRRVAVIHADISSLGQIFRTIATGAENIAAVRKAASAIEEMLTESARAAVADCLLPFADVRTGIARAVIPARPIVLGGDDVGVIVRADLALPFTRRLLKELEERSVAVMTNASGPKITLPSHLSACAGIAVVNAGQPFLMSSALAESLCKFAKKTAKTVRTGAVGPYPSLIAFHNAQSTLREEYDDIRHRELEWRPGHLLTGNPYNATGTGSGSSLDDLIAVARELADAPGTGKLVEAARLLFADPDRAGAAWTRWRKVLMDVDKDRLLCLDRLLGTEPEAWPSVAALITDAMEWIDFGLMDAPNRSVALERTCPWPS